MAAPTAARASRAGADLSDPAFPLLAVVVLTAGPYLYPMVYSGVVKFQSIGGHVAFCVLLGLLHLTLYALYRMFVPMPRLLPTADDRFADLFFAACRIFVYAAIVANLALVAIAVSRLGDGFWARKAIVAEGGGVFILTQLHVWFVGPYVALGRLRGAPIARPLAVLLAAVFLRAILVGERIALLELAIPLLVVFSLLGDIRIGWARLTAIILSVPAFFLATEVFRSFYAKFVDTASGWNEVTFSFLLQWNLERFFSYYVDVANKLYLKISEETFGATDYWRKGIDQMLARFGLAEFPEADLIFELLERQGAWAIELTNPGGLQQIASDFGYWGILVYAGLIGLLLLSHAAARRGSLFAFGAFPVLYVAFADLVRLVYLYETRALLPFVLFLGTWLALRLVASSETPRVTGPGPAAARSRGP
jgi:hypothetical protein